jgi:hypothetical protein
MGLLLWAFAFGFWLFEGEGFLDEGKLLEGDC